MIVCQVCGELHPDRWPDRPVTVSDAAEHLGLRVFDTAVPQTFWHAWWTAFGESCAGQVVWCYDTASTFGAPVALTRRARARLVELAERTAMS